MADRGNGQPPQYGVWSTNVVAPEGMTMIPPPPTQEDYTVRAMIATFCCCWILGVCAMMKIAESRKSYRIGDTVTARAQADQARMLSNIGIGVGMASVLILLVVIIVVNILK